MNTPPEITYPGQGPYRFLTISYGRALFNPDNPERARLAAVASATTDFHTIVFSLRRHDVPDSDTAGDLTLHATNSRVRSLMLLDAILLGRQIIRERPGVWVVTAQDPFEAGLVGWVIARSTGSHLNVQEHGDVFSTPHWRQESLGNRVRYHFGRWLLRHADSVRVVAPRIRRTLEALGVESARIRELAVVTDTKHVATATPSPVVREHFDQDAVVVLSVARFVPQKNLPLLVRAFARAAATVPKLRLMLVGDGPERQRIEKAITAAGLPSGHMVLRPWSDDVPGLMHAADIYALSSNYEGWGRVLIEAQAAGLPIATTDVGCVGTALQPEEHALVAPVGDEAAIAAALERLASDQDLRARLAANNRAAASAAPTPADYAPRWIAAHTPAE